MEAACHRAGTVPHTIHVSTLYKKARSYTTQNPWGQPSSPLAMRQLQLQGLLRHWRQLTLPDQAVEATAAHADHLPQHLPQGQLLGDHMAGREPLTMYKLPPL